MSSALDMSLDDVIKTQKNNRQRSNRGARSSGPTRNNRHSRDNKPYQAGAQPYRGAATAPLHTAVIRQSVPDGSKIQVSNLDHRVSAEDLKHTLVPKVIDTHADFLAPGIVSSLSLKAQLMKGYYGFRCQPFGPVV
ncbi:hypothetical protein BGZ46_010145 [Entomortierella lignicola]|nr:hypothetical protein BGZ46_010145 [Entomortierella lignicola]